MVVYRIPASTSNLGPGFDSLGLALSLYNEVEIDQGGTHSEDPFIRQAGDAFFSAIGKEPCGFSCRITGDVPRSRGLGSSVTVRLGILAGLNALHGERLSREELFQICRGLEGHPDNAAASCFGGFTICLPDGGWRRFAIDERLKFLLVVPGQECSTEKARKAVPTSFSREDTVFNLSHAAAVAACLASGRYEEMTNLFADRIHQPARSEFLPHLSPVLEAAQGAGALGGWLSGSGSAVAIVTLERVEAICSALSAVPGCGEILSLKADNAGLQQVNPGHEAV